jgi:hypothetical protein
VDFDEARWSALITKPDWYLVFNEFKSEASRKLKPGSREMDRLNKTARHFFEEALKKDRVALGQGGPDLDAQRQPVDNIVIHHTSAKAGYRLSYMESTQLLNVYAAYYANPTVRGERGLKGQPIWSGHFRDGKQTFLCYHWLMRMDGKFERLLEDNQIGWHAGDWRINRRSVAICLDNDYEQICPTEDLLAKLAEHIKKNYPNIKPENIIGHCEARQGTICPGAHFMSEWKSKLARLIK